MSKNTEAVKTEAPKKAKAQGPGFKEKVSKFFRGYISEIKKITWPSRKQVWNNTLVTIVTVLIVGVFIWILDMGLEWLRELIFQIGK